ncbi:MAG: hypothetical protein V7K14_28425 [Nostoc sp.]
MRTFMLVALRSLVSGSIFNYRSFAAKRSRRCISYCATSSSVGTSSPSGV